MVAVVEEFPRSFITWFGRRLTERLLIACHAHTKHITFTLWYKKQDQRIETSKPNLIMFGIPKPKQQFIANTMRKLYMYYKGAGTGRTGMWGASP